MIKPIYIVLGSLFVALGVVGIVVPGLPTTPFLLLASGCFLKSSKRLHDWLINHKLLSKYIRSFQQSRRNPKRIKIFAITMMWTMICGSCYFFIESVLINILLIVCGVAGSILILFFEIFFNKNNIHNNQ
jgi:uncharacterized membrane protein YbaN (DUF454 family)